MDYISDRKHESLRGGIRSHIIELIHEISRYNEGNHAGGIPDPAIISFQPFHLLSISIYANPIPMRIYSASL